MADRQYLIFAKRLVRIAVQPALTRLRRSDDRMPACMRMFGGVPIRTEEEFLSRVRRAEPYSTVKVVVMRGEQRIEVPVNLGRN